MRARVLGVCLAILCTTAGPLAAQTEHEDTPKKAVCRTCEMRGATHGAEDVVAWREYENARYYFCSHDCAKAFDGFPEAYVPQALPRPAPDATTTTLAGESLALSELRGKVVLLDFWATWCAPCVKAVPTLNELHAQWKDHGFTVLGVSIDENPQKVVPKFVEKKKIQYPIALDTGETPAWHAYRVAAIPAMFLVDREGQIVAQWRGAIDMKTVKATVEGLVGPSASTK